MKVRWPAIRQTRRVQELSLQEISIFVEGTHAPSSRTERWPLFWASNFSKVSCSCRICLSCPRGCTQSNMCTDPDKNMSHSPGEFGNLPQCTLSAFSAQRADLQVVHHAGKRLSSFFPWSSRCPDLTVTRMAEGDNEDPLADPVAVIITLQQYQKKLSTEVELLRQDVATSKAFQAKYGVRLQVEWGDRCCGYSAACETSARVCEMP